jgi:hypothetical protein
MDEADCCSLSEHVLLVIGLLDHYGMQGMEVGNAR